MIFSSWQFIFVYLPVVCFVFFLIPQKKLVFRKVWLLLVSIGFYGYWRWEYIPLLVGSIIINYSLAEAIYRYHKNEIRRALLIIGICFNLALLGYYKYSNFLVDTVSTLVGVDKWMLDIALPLAISFYTFTQIIYLVDVFKDKNVHSTPLDYSLFAVFFPHLIAGPIVRHWEIIPQYSTKGWSVSKHDIFTGVALFLIGLSKKVLLADPLSHYVDTVYQGASHGLIITSFDAWLATLSFSMQIYFDFSGYSDMAIGLARIFGITFPCNFNSPYKATSVTDFWRRWHITLTRFFREFVYYPLGGNRCHPGREYMNVIVTMFLSGLWHGAGWTFVLWGLLHGFALVVCSSWRKIKNSLFPSRNEKTMLGSLFATTATFTFVCLGWVLFRAGTIETVKGIYQGIFFFDGITVPAGFRYYLPFLSDGIGNIIRFVENPVVYPYRITMLLISIGAMGICFFAPNSQQLLSRFKPVLENVEYQGKSFFSFNLSAGFILGFLFFLVLHSLFQAVPTPFIYFNF